MNPRPLNLYEDIIDKLVPELLSLIRKTLNPDKFEELIKFYFERIGATEVFITNKNNKKEGDADVIAHFDFIKTSIYVQAKFHDEGTITGDWGLIQIEEYLKAEEKENDKEEEKEIDEDYSHIGWLISTADDFTENTKEKARQKKLKLINGVEFSRMLLDAGILNLEI